MGIQLRHRCRNPRCGCKLPEPVENPHAAFCTKGCWQQYHRSRCCVCEEPYERKTENQLRCGRRKCASEFRSWPHVYNPFGVEMDGGLKSARGVGRNPIKSALEMPPGLRSWVWQRLSGEDEDYGLLDGQGKVVARVCHEGALWWVAYPRCFPDPPLETLDQARSRAISLALASLPEGVPENRAKNRSIIKAIRQERKLYPWRFSDAGERYAAGATHVAVATAAPAANDDDIDIPEFLRRARAHESVN
jgi:hypothetical protein